MSTKKIEAIEFMPTRLENEFYKTFNRHDEILKIFERINIIDKFNYTSKLESELYKINPAYKMFDNSTKLSRVLSLSNELNKQLSNSILNQFELLEYFKNFQKSNQSIIDILNTSEFIEDFINEHNEVLNEDIELQEADLNVFGELINQEIDNQNIPYKSNKNLDFRKIALGFQVLIYTVFILYITNLDRFADYKEAFVFFINHIECKGITISRVNLRIEPDFNSEIIVAIPRDSILLIYEETNNGWVKVKININNIDLDGYISEAYIRRLIK